MFKFLNNHQKISLLLSILIIVLIPIFSNLDLNQILRTVLFWNMYGNIMFLNKWSKDGITWFRKSDKDYNKNITRKHSDFIFIAVIFASLIIFLSLTLSIFNINLVYNYAFIIIIEIIIILLELLLAYSTARVNKQIMQIIPNKK